MQRKLLVALTLVGALLAMAVPASASLGRVIPSGLPSNPTDAQTTVRQLIDIDANVRATVAQDIGVKPADIDVSQIVVVGQTSCRVGTSSCINTGRDSAGKIHTTNFKNGQVVMAWKFKTVVQGRTLTFKFKGDCSNPLLRKRVRHLPRARVVSKPIVVKFDRSFVKKFSVTCPDGKVIPIEVNTRVRTTFRGRIWAKIVGQADLKVKSSLELEISQQVKVGCVLPALPPVSIPPTPTPTSTTTIIQIVQLGCSVVGNNNDGNAVCSPTTVVVQPPPVVVLPPPPPPPVVSCPSGSIRNPETGLCVKDGSSTPPPPSTAPGSNPVPSPQDPAPGGNMCFSESTGLPVTPISHPDGTKTCPVGSFGG